MSRFRVAIDIGGTFTDIVFLDAEGRLHIKKVSSSVDDYARSIVDGLREVFDETGLGGRDVVEVLHGTTVASNARTALTPSSSNPIWGCTARSSALTTASAQQRSSPAGEMTPSASPLNSRPSAQESTTFAQQRPLARRWNSKSFKRRRSPPTGSGSPTF